MSNTSLINRIEESINKYRSGEISRKALISSLEQNGRALEMMPYALIKEIDDIEHQLTVAQFSEEEDCLPTDLEALSQLSCWLSKVPR